MADYGADAEKLLIGDLRTGVLDPADFVADAASEMDARIGFVYDLDTLNVNTLAPHVQALLKLIHTRLASGNLLLEAAGIASDDELHAYGLSLVKKAEADLCAIEQGRYDLGATRSAGDDTQTSARIINADATSAVDSFYDFTTRGELPTWAPGAELP